MADFQFPYKKIDGINYLESGQPSPYCSVEAKKDPKWILANIMWYYTQWNQFVGSGAWYGYYDRFERNDQFASGNQPTWIYQQAFDIIQRDGASANAMFRDDWMPNPIIPVRVDFMQDMVISSFGKLKATAIDPWSDDERDAWQADVLMEINHGKELRQTLQVAGIQGPPEPPPDQPQSFDELEIYNAFGGPKLACELDAQKGVRFLEALNDVPELRQMITRDLITNHLGVYINRVLPETRKVEINRIRPQDAMLPPSNSNDYSDMQWGGWFQVVTKSEFIEMTQDQFSGQEVEEIFKKYGGWNRFTMINNSLAQYKVYDYQPYRYYPTQNMMYRDQLVLCNMWFYSPIYQTYKEKKNKYGKTVVTKMPFEEAQAFKDKKQKIIKENEEGKKRHEERFGAYIGASEQFQPQYVPGGEIRETSKKGVFMGTWIIGSEIIFNADMQKFMKRKQKSLYNTPPPMSVFRLPGLSPVERMIPGDKDFNLSRFQKNNVIARTGPPIIAVSEGALVTGESGLGGALEPTEEITAALQSGTMIIKATNPESGVTMPVNQAIMVIDRKLSDQVAGFDIQMERALKLIDDVSGFNPVTNGSAVNPKTPVAIADQMNVATSRAVKPLLRALQRLEEMNMTAALGKLQLVLEDGDVEAYANGMGNTVSIRIGRVPGMSYRDFGVFLVPEWTDDERANFEEALRLEIERGTLDGVDTLLIKKAPDDDVRMRVMMLIRKKKQQEAAAQQQAMMQQQMQQNAQLQQQAFQEKTQLESQKAEGKNAIIQNSQKARDISSQLNHQLELEKMDKAAQLDVQMQTVISTLQQHMDEQLARLEGRLKLQQIDLQGNKMIQVEESKPTPKAPSKG